MSGQQGATAGERQQQRHPGRLHGEAVRQQGSSPVRHSWKHSTSASILSMHWRSRGCRSCQRSITPRRLKVATLNVAVAPPCILLGVALRFTRRLPNKRLSTDWAKGAAAKPRKAPKEEWNEAAGCCCHRHHSWRMAGLGTPGCPEWPRAAAASSVWQAEHAGSLLFQQLGARGCDRRRCLRGDSIF